MKKVTRAKVALAKRVPISGIGSNIASEHKYDNNAVDLVLHVTSGPIAMLDKRINAKLSIDQIVGQFPHEFLERLKTAMEEDQQ